MSQSLLRRLPSVERAANHPEILALIQRYPAPLIRDLVRQELAEMRRLLAAEASEEPSREALLQELVERTRQRVALLFASPLRPLLNATGVVLHTGLGRAPLADAAREAVARVTAGYCSLEFELASGRRGERNTIIHGLLCALCGAEAAVVVNNNAAAVLLALNTLSQGKEAIISRGQLIEIGGSFRLPEVMEKSGTRMREIGTTNRTRLQDYAAAIGPETGVVVIAHTSNYRVVGFTEEAEVAGIVELAHRHGLPVLHDLGGGALVDLRRFGLPREPLVQESVLAGVDVVTFSGDKVLGGPQSGLIAGKADFIQRIHANPLMRALRCDKMVFAALEATLRLYFAESSLLETHPVLAMLCEPEAAVRQRAESVRQALHRELAEHMDITLQPSLAQAGSGTLPLEKIPSHALVLQPRDGRVDHWAARLRTGHPAVVGYIQDGAIWLDLRTIRASETTALVDALNALAGPPRSGEQAG